MQTTLVDTHAHLDLRQFDGDRQAVLRRARDTGVSTILTVGTELASSRRAVAMAARYESVYAAVGMHPHNAARLDGETLAELRSLALQPKVLAVGEIGLDYYRNRSPRDAQRRAFRAQLAWAGEFELPVVVHDRDAHDEVIDILADWAAGQQSSPLAGRLGVLHTFSGDLTMAKQAIDLGFYISISGPVTYRNERRLPDIVRALPLGRILVETDCPYLTPHPHRGARNEPAYVRLVAARIAELRGMALDELAQATTENAIRLLGRALNPVLSATKDRQAQASLRPKRHTAKRGDVD